jgi:hypothetical protein
MTVVSALSKQIFLFAAAISALAIVPLEAAEKQKSYSFNVLSGKPHRVDTYLSWKNNCVGVIGKAKEITKPKHGTATSRIETTTIRRANAGSVRNCRGKKISGISIYYKSKSGFRGRDTFVMSDGTTVYTYKMQVH